MKKFLLFLTILGGIESFAENDTLTKYFNLQKEIEKYIFGEKLEKTKEMIGKGTYKSYNYENDKKFEEFENELKKLKQDGLILDNDFNENVVAKLERLSFLKKTSFVRYQNIRFKTYSNYKIEPAFDDDVYFKVGFNQGIAKGDIQGLNATVGANYLVKDNIKLGGFIHYDNKLGDLTKTHAHIGVIGVNGKFKLKDNKGEIESFIAYKYNYGKYQNKIDTYGNIDDMINKNIEKYYDESVHQHSIEIFNKYSKGFKIVKNLKISPQVENYLSISSSIKYSNIFVDDNKFDEIIYRFIGEKKKIK
ncbi:hypothetical protein KX935_04675 [Streptobacillus moniliformis]|nr:hypothetical protein KX935_04675 [Streptobacillus moniliformis]